MQYNERETVVRSIYRDRGEDKASITVLLLKKDRLYFLGRKRISRYYIKIMKRTLYNLPV